MDLFTRIIFLTCIPCLVHLALYFCFPSVKRILKQDVNIVEYYPFLKFIGWFPFPVFMYIVIEEYLSNGIVDAMICSILLISDFFIIMYFNRKIIILKDKNYFIYRNLFFIKTKINWDDIESFQLYRKMIFINLKKKRIFFDIGYIFNENVLLTEFNNHRIKQLKKKSKN